MIKHFCDRCGAEFPSGSLSADGGPRLVQMFVKTEFHNQVQQGWHFCTGCVTALRDWIRKGQS